MKVVISQAKFCNKNYQIFKDYSILEKYNDGKHYVEYVDWSQDSVYRDNPKLYWSDNTIVVDLNNDELIKLIQELTNECECIIGYESKEDHKNYGTDFHIRIYDDYVE